MLQSSNQHDNSQSAVFSETDNFDSPVENNGTQIDPMKKDLWYTYAGNWIWRATECLVELKDFEPKASWVAKRLNISVEKAVTALEGLEELGLIKRKNNTLVRNQFHTHIKYPDYTADEMRNVHFNNVSQINSKIEFSDHFFSSFFTCSQKKKTDFMRKLKVLFSEYTEDVDVKEHDQVLGLNFTLVNVTDRRPS